MKLQDKRIWITGASSGIGEALAIALAEHGARLVLSARRVDKLQQLQQRLIQPQFHQAIVLDQSLPEQIERTVQSVLAGFGEIDILINNAGVSCRALARETQLVVSRQVMELNYFGTVALTQALLPVLLRQSSPMVVTIASVAGRVGGKTLSSYAASKHAILGYMDSLRAEESANGLSVLNVCPGFVITNITRNALTASGEPFGEMAKATAAGISAAQCAEQIIRAMRRQQAELVVGRGISRWAPLLNRLSPTLVRMLAARKDYRE